jgi:uncharacterized protein YggU (UPF0235/DUF167 family)
MEIKAIIHTQANRRKIVFNKTSYNIWVRSDPIGNRANEEIIALVAKTFNVSGKSVKIIKGSKGSRKTIYIENGNSQT